MNQRVKLVISFGRPLVLAVVLGLSLLSGAVVAADQAGPTVSKAIAKPLKAAQDALAAKNYDDAIAKIKEVQAQAGEKTAYDSYVINALLLQAYGGKHDMPAMFAVLASTWQSQYTPPEQKKVWLKALAQYYYQEKDYSKALDAADEAVKVGVNDADIMGLIAKSDYLLGKYKEAATTQQDIVSKQEKPDEESLKLLWQFDLKANDNAGAAKTVEKLVAYYPKPEYWANALASLVNSDTKDAHLQLNVYRLMSDVGVLKRGGDYAEMADIALDEGYPGETEAVLQKAFAANVFTEQRDKDRYQHLLDGAKQRAAADQAALPKAEADAATAATGDRFVQVGAAYLSYGQADKAVSFINKGIAKGGLKYPEEATLLLGIAQLRAHNAAEAQRDFEKVGASNNSGYARLGKLWALHAGAKSAA
jgi:hypothetical protein